MDNLNEFFMKEAIKEAEKCLKFCDVPIGAVIVKDNVIIGRGHNTRELAESPIAHAEMNALLDASKALGMWRLTDCDIYVTIEPCPMCTGAIYQSRIRTIYYGAPDEKAGSCGSVFNLFDYNELNHKCHVVSGLLENECKLLLKVFFRKRRKSVK